MACGNTGATCRSDSGVIHGGDTGVPYRDYAGSIYGIILHQYVVPPPSKHMVLIQDQYVVVVLDKYGIFIQDKHMLVIHIQYVV